MFVDVEQYGTFTLDSDFLEPYQDKPVDWGYGALSWATYKRTYSRDGEDWWETCRRVIEGMFTVQRVHCLERNLPWDDDKATRFAEKAYDRLFHFKWTPPGRGLWMMGTDYIYERGGAALNNCFAGETEIITAEGTKTLEECAGTTQTLLTRQGEWVEAPIRSFGEQELRKVTLSRQGQTKVVYATPDHRWFSTDRRQAHRDKGYVEFTTDELRPGIHRLQYVFGNGIKSNTPSSFGIAHGITYGDGTSVPGDRHANHLMLCGPENRQLARYFEMCPKTERPEACEEGGLRIGGLPNFFRERPSLDETKSYLYGWLAGYFAADGTCKSNGQVQFASASREDLEFVRDVCYVLGIGTYSICEEERGSNLTEGDRQRSMYQLTLMRDTLDEDFFLIDEHRQRFRDNPVEQKQYWNVEAVEETDRREEVFCATVEGKGAFALADNILTGNCGFVSTKSIDEDFASPFTWMFGMSMLGVGVGFDTRGKGEVRIQAPDRASDTHVIGDSREGWVEALERLLNAYVGDDTLPAEWDYSEIRPKGAPLESFGGTASGPDPLEKMLETLEEMYDAYVGDQVDAQLIVDTMNIAGRCVVAGGIRRTAQISFGDKDDEQFLDLKLDDEKVREYRWASNNSIFADVGMDYSEIAERTGVNGEPGYMWLENARKYGRMKDEPNWDDEQAEGGNPCLEQTLWDRELCTLVETYPAHHESYEDFRETLKIAYQYAKTVTLIGTHDAKTNAVMLRNRRIGCSMTGIVQAINKHGYREFFDWCDEGYDYIQDLDHKYSDWLCVPRSIKSTSVKPSGTVSILAGSTPGVHWDHSPYYLRRVRVAASHNLVEVAREAGYPVEPDPYADDTMVIGFPVEVEGIERGKSEVSLREKIDLAARMQFYWSDNQVSCTAEFDPETEADEIPRILEAYEDRLKGISFLPMEDHGYEMPPYEEISEDEYEEMMADVDPIQEVDLEGDLEDKFCDGAACEVDDVDGE